MRILDLVKPANFRSMGPPSGVPGAGQVTKDARPHALRAGAGQGGAGKIGTQPVPVRG